MADTNHAKKLGEELRKHAAYFLERESNNQSLITVTQCSVSDDSKYATVFITVLPETKEQAVLDFANRNKDALRDYIKKHTRTRIIPYFDIKIDLGEKNRQTVDTLLRESPDSKTF
jgi:ribosome-binding factor A